MLLSPGLSNCTSKPKPEAVNDEKMVAIGDTDDPGPEEWFHSNIP